MPSERKQLNVRLSPRGEDLLREVTRYMEEEAGTDVSQAAVVHAALAALARRCRAARRKNPEKSGDGA
jgi:hypothetical protein